MMARNRKAGLTDPQIRVLEVLDRFQRKAGYPPSIREIKDKAQLSSTSVVNYYLDQLEEMGYIERDEHVSRGIRLVKSLAEIIPSATSKARQVVNETFAIPVIGRIFASEPVPVPASNFSYMDFENTVDVALSMLPVRGDSMVDAMVYEGDIVIMKPTKDVRNGDMVAIWLDDRDETTLKYFYLENGRVRLQPANPTMNPIFIENPETVQVQGKVVMVIRSMKEGIKQ
jgi:repressor LexA